MPNQKNIVIAGAGTSGLTTALILKKTFPFYNVSIVFSKDAPIIGVGEGSTEHWRWFQDYVGINVHDMIKYADITHKYGIKFEGWNSKNSSYFHSISGSGLVANDFYGTYTYCIENDLLLTNTFSWRGIIKDKIVLNIDEEGNNKSHYGTNQYHFDTHKLNDYLKNFCSNFGINLIEGNIDKVIKNESGYVTGLKVSSFDHPIPGDFFIDCTGFARVIMSGMQNQEFVSYKDFLPCDSALVFQTPLDEYGKIHPYTIAKRMNAGWMWEIPTQSRRGNGYVFSSKYITDEQAISEASEKLGIDIEDYRILRFKTGYWKETWQKNCVSIGLSSGFIEPLEATSISVSIQQAKLLCSYISSFGKVDHYSDEVMMSEYHRVIDSIMENCVSMISLHYICDIQDTDMWRDQSKAPIPRLLSKLVRLWNTKMPQAHDINTTGFELFYVPHFWHVAQGQNTLNKEVASVQLDAYGSRPSSINHINELTAHLLAQKEVDHAEELRACANSDS